MTITPDNIIFKVMSTRAWQTALKDGVFAGSVDDLRDGFIHLSARHQIRVTLAKHYRNAADLVLIAYNPSDLGPDLKWEVSRGGDVFPHLYAPLPAALALWSKPLTLGADGVPQVPLEIT
jgi:uncharacterized protein (DUF952 family)